MSWWRASPPRGDRSGLLAEHCQHALCLAEGIGTKEQGVAIGCGLPRAREIIAGLPGSVRLPGGELRARPADLEAWLEQRRIAA